MAWIFDPLTLVLLAGAVAVSAFGRRSRLAGRVGPWVGEGAQKTPRDGPRLKAEPLDIAADVELFAACLRAGVGVTRAVGAVADAAGPGSRETWLLVGSLLAVGVSPERAWAPTEGIEGLQDVATLVVLSEQSGAAIAGGCERIVDSLRADSAAHATAGAERAGVLIALPLALCFLPAFIVLGLVPVVISLGSQLL